VKLCSLENFKCVTVNIKNFPTFNFCMTGLYKRFIAKTRYLLVDFLV